MVRTNIQSGTKPPRAFAWAPPPLFALLLAHTLLVVTPAFATTLARLSLDQLAGGSEAVARVRCQSATARWENGSIWTLTTVQVLETMKGSLPTEIVIRLPGGRVGHLTASVDGVPRFRPGDEAFLFLKPARAGGFTVAAWVEGTFRIARDPRTLARTVTQDSGSFAVFDAAIHEFRAAGVHRMPVDEFRARLAASIARTREKSR